MLYFDNSNLSQRDVLILHENLIKEGQNLLISYKNHQFYGKNELIFKDNGLIIFGQIQAKTSIQLQVLETIANNFSNTNFGFLNDIDLAYNLIILSINSDEIFAIRDYFGIKPLFFTTHNDIKCISNTIPNLKKIYKTKFEPNENEIWEYLGNSYDDSEINSETFFKDIQRVIPGQIIQFKHNNLQKHQTHQNHFKSQIIENSTPIFRKVLERQIDMIDQEFPIGCHLSGGLDSTSLAGLLNQDTKAIYYNTGLESTNEFDYANIAAKRFEIEIFEIFSQNDVLDKIRTTTKLTGQPECLIIPSFIFYEIHELSKKLGCKNMVSGHGGDAIVGTGYEYFDILFNSNKKSELKYAFQQYNNFKTTYTYDEYILNKIKYQVFRFSFLKAIFSYIRFKPNNKLIFKTIISKLKNFSFKHHRKLIFKDLKRNKTNNSFSTGNLNIFQKQHINNNFISLSNHALEISDVISEHFESETYYPFLSKNLLNVAINTPSEINFDLGRGRGLLRSAMRDILPFEILNRIDKTSFSEFEYHILKSLWHQYGQFLKSNHKLWKYVKRDVYLEEINEILKTESNYQQNKNKTHQCCRILYLGIWMDQEF